MLEPTKGASSACFITARHEFSRYDTSYFSIYPVFKSTQRTQTDQRTDFWRAALREFPTKVATQPTANFHRGAAATPFINRNHGQDSLQAICQGPQEGHCLLWTLQEAYRDLLLVHLQGSQAGPPRYRNLQKGHVHHELVHQRYFRAHCFRSRKVVHLQQEGYSQQPRDPNRRPSHVARRIGQARRF